MKLPSLMNVGVKVKQGYSHALAKLSLIFTLALMTASAHAVGDYDFETLVDNGQTAEETASNIDNVMNIGFNLIKALGVFVGLWLIYAGIMRIKKANEPNSQTTPMQGALFILLGGCLGALPFIFLTSASIVQG